MNTQEAIEVLEEQYKEVNRMAGTCGENWIDLAFALKNAIELFKANNKTKGILPERLTGEHENCWEIDIDYCVSCGKTVDIHPERISGHNNCLNLCTPVVSKLLLKIKEIEKLLANAIKERDRLKSKGEGLIDCLSTRDYAIKEYKKERYELKAEIERLRKE